jgi:hypothetical protein
VNDKVEEDALAVERLRTADGGPFAPADFVIPEPPQVDSPRGELRLEPLSEQHAESDFRAWTGSLDHIRASRGFPWGGWPPLDGSLDLAANGEDMRRHARLFAARQGFTWTVLEDSGECVGCVYVYPDRQADADLHTWVVSSRALDDEALRGHVLDWLIAEWPFADIEAH